MSIVCQHDKRSGITYAYESRAYWGKGKRRSGAERRLIGRVDGEAGEIVPTDGRMGRAEGRAAEPDHRALHERAIGRVADLEAEVARLRGE